MSKIPHATLGDIAEFVNGLAFSPADWDCSGRKIIRIQNLTDKSKPYNLTAREVDGKYIVNPGDLLVSWSATLGVFEWIEEESAILNQHIFRVLPDEIKVAKPFLKHALERSVSTMGRHTHGATMKHINRAEFLNTPIYLPSLPEQRRIAAILDKADAIRHKQQEAIRLTEELLRSAFLEMFGDPVTNPKEWEIRKLGDISKVQGGLQVSHSRANYPIEVPYLRVANIYRDKLYLDEIKKIMVSPSELSRSALRNGDILMVEGHGNPNEIGRSAVWNASIDPCVHQNHLIRVRLNSRLALPQFVSYFLNSPGGRRQLFRFGKTTSGLNTISTSNVHATEIIIPPIELQQCFLELVKKSESLTIRLEKSFSQATVLFNSLIQRAFRGELTAHNESSESIISAHKVIPLKRTKEYAGSVSTEAQRHAGHDMYNKAALAAYIVLRCHNPAEPMGRVKLAKLFYLVQRKVDLALTESFTRRAAGPLDDAIFKFLPFAQKHNWIVLLPQIRMKKPVGPGSACDDAVTQTIKYLGERRSAVDEVLDSLKDMKGHTLECWATVDAIAEELSTSGKTLTVRNILQTLAASPEWRPKLEKPAFSELNIATALVGLRKMGFVTVD